ncbi:UNVERIFIED_CONTAM: hypothetical protein Slati_3922600 [Sesamum latifolium]|uniref:BED-type domain-containing protein n=1 Tax=Sesamum latifolium TaxID=2727402 RepID=A0AAW2TP29_9LAMI
MSSSGQNVDTSSLTHTSTPPLHRGKTDMTWNHVVEKLIDGNKVICCLYCGKVSTGGGINRMKQHLAGKKERGHLDNYDEIKEIQKQEHDKSTPPSARRGKAQSSQSTKIKHSSKVDEYFAPRTTPGSQPTIKSVLAGKEAIKRAHIETARFFYDTCIPINACNSRYFQRMFDTVIAIAQDIKFLLIMIYGFLLKDSKKELQLWVDNIRNICIECGCTIMGDGWTDNSDRTLINFLIYCPRGTIFWKSVDASDFVKDAQALFKLFKEVIEWAGPTNVVHLVTDNGANYVAAGRLIQDHYKSINWSPCAAHCLNLVMKDIGKLDHVAEIVSKASQVTRFVYNHIYWLAWLRKRKDWTEIIRPEVMNGVLEVITTKGIGSKSKLLHETKLFRDRLESFGRELALETCTNTQPDDADAIEDIEPVEDLEVDDDIDFLAFEQFNHDGKLHDISIGVGEGGSNSRGVMYGEHEEWLRRV